MPPRFALQILLYTKTREATNAVLLLYKAKSIAGQSPHLETLSFTKRKRKHIVDDLKIIIYSFMATSNTIKMKQLLFPSFYSLLAWKRLGPFHLWLWTASVLSNCINETSVKIKF